MLFINNGYTDKNSYCNGEYVKVYEDCVDFFENIKLLTKNAINLLLSDEKMKIFI